ncbi:type II CAAX endopeptidase family protein [uncultured Proteiniphilum sp.]|uniref:CPBP family intramembrane glutamic endopeptidase n=1 Tax=uncultured Proteiniphilum sp. TaxID=497637 RepID=UPI00262BC584|nr:type II CAAX endopeptidase family protein [uncultured Proteiniphilum sp.]
MKHLERALQGKNGIGRYILMAVIVMVAAQIAVIPLFLLLFPAILSNGGNIGDLSAAIQNPSDWGISSNLFLLVMLGTFVITFLLFAVLVKPLHGRTVRETINGRRQIRWDRIRVGIIVWGIIILVDTVISLLISSPGEYEFRLNAGAFFPLLLIILIIMPFQTSIEEILFRGYLAQGAARWTKSRWWALIIPSVLFALMHIANPEVKEYGLWLSMPQYLIMGLMLGLISILDDGIELALGIHFINNALTAVLVTHQASALQTDALFLLHDLDPVASLISISIASLLVVFILQRIYKWDFGIMNKKVEHALPPTPPVEVVTIEQSSPV